MKKTTIINEAYNEKQVNELLSVDPSTLEDLRAYYEKYVNDFMGSKYHDITVKFNSRIKRALGQFVHRRDGLGVGHIELSLTQVILDYKGGTNLMLDVLKHEAIHAMCYGDGLDERDGSYDFESKLAQYNVSSSGATNNKCKLGSKKSPSFYLVQDVYDCYKDDGTKLARPSYQKHTKSACCEKYQYEFGEERVLGYMKRVGFRVSVVEE